MSKPKPQAAANLEEAGPPGRSALFQWLRKEYSHLAKTLNGPSPNWVKLAAEAEQAGLVGTNGRPQSRGALRKMWLRVRKEVEREEATKLERRLARKVSNRSPRRAVGSHSPPAAVHPALTPARMPEPAHHPPNAASPAGPAARRTPAPARLPAEELTPEAKAQIDKLRNGLADWDRRRHGT